MKKLLRARATVLASLFGMAAFAQSEIPAECPVSHKSAAEMPKNHGHFASSAPKTNQEWWPNTLDLGVLRQHGQKSNPMRSDFNYKEAFSQLDYAALKLDLKALMTQTQDWWPADFGHYGPLFVRMAWHSAGTYRTGDGRGGGSRGQQRFAPINSWPDNANLDKARALLWPIKQKYGSAISWADLMILTGNVALESMGFETAGFGAGREDVWEPESNIYWGPESKWLDNQRYKNEELERPLAAVQMGLIYVNPEGPNGVPDPILAAHDIRETFARMGMNDEETVALIAGGHTFGKTHGAAPSSHMGPEPEAAPIENQGFGWTSNHGSGKGADAITSGLEVTWTQTPTQWGLGFLKALFAHEWELTKSPAGAHQWVAKDAKAMVPDAFDANKKHLPTMLTTDLSLRFDSVYAKISRRFLNNPEEYRKAFANAWFKLTHRDMGPNSRLWGPEVPKEPFIWQDPLPKTSPSQLGQKEISELKKAIQESGLTSAELVRTAWASASTFRSSDRRGGANGARIRFEPMRSWEVNKPDELNRVLNQLEGIRARYNGKAKANKNISMADLIVLGGNVGVEMAAKKAGFTVEVPFSQGRIDAIEAQTDAKSFAVLEPMADAFRNYQGKLYTFSPEELLIDKAQLLDLSAPEMTILLGGMRAIGANYDGSGLGMMTETPGVLNNAFFVNLLDRGTEWKAMNESRTLFEGRSRKTGMVLWRGSRVDLIFGSNSELRALAEVYASEDYKGQFIQDFIAAWNKVMNADRFDLSL